MPSLNPTIVLCLDTRFVRPDGTHFLSVRLTLNRVQKYHSLGIPLSREEWKKMSDGSPLRDARLRGVRDTAIHELQRAKALAAGLAVFSFDGFTDAWSGVLPSPPTPPDDCVMRALARRQAAFEANGQVSCADICSAVATLLTALSGERLPVAALTTAYLQSLEADLLRRGRKLSTVGFYTRELRAVCQEMMRAGLMSQDAYPFGRGRYVIPAPRKRKKALPATALRKLLDYRPQDAGGDNFELRSHGFWLLSYLSDGANFTDLLCLKNKNVNARNRTLTFVRQKTAASLRGGHVERQAYLYDESLAVIERWAVAGGPEDYVFPFLEKAMSARRKKAVTENFISVTNDWMRRIGKGLDVPWEGLTTYVARHSFGTQLKRAGVSTSFIQERYGHTSERTTQFYLGDFEEDEARPLIERALLGRSGVGQGSELVGDEPLLPA